jgi:tRNA G37 N-methylase Trm5
MNLPEKAIDFLDAGITALRPTGGAIHFYRFISASDSMEDIKSEFTEMIEKLGRRVKEISSSRRVRETAPYEWQAVLDAKIG